MKLKRITACCLAGLLSLMTITGCTRQTAEAPETDLLPGAAAVQDGILTNIFKAEEFVLPDGYSLGSWMEPVSDDAVGTITIGASHSAGQRVILTLDGSGNPIETLALPLSSENSWLSEGAYFGCTAAYITNYSTDTRKAVFQLHVIRTGDTEPLVIPDLAQFFEDDDGMESYRVAVDGEGYLWLACTWDRVFVLTPDLKKAGTVEVPGLIRDITTDRDGRILVLTGAEQDSLVQILDRQSLSVTREIRLKGTSADGLFRCAGYDFAYSDDIGVKGYTVETDTSVLLMDYQNSNTSSADFTVCGVTDSDTIIGVRKNPLTNRSLLSLFRRTEDVDLSGVLTVEIAAVEPDNYIAAQITAFNEENPGIRVILHDYSVYSNQENPDGGNQKLTIDMLNGLLEPDLVYGRPSQSYMAELAENGLYTDLNPLLEKDGYLSADDLYRCVRTAFTDDEGVLWGMSRTFSLKTLLSTAEYVGDRDSWTVEEMTEILSTLLDGRYIMEDLGRYSAMDMLLGECGYSLFFDADKGLNGFNSTEFRDLLAYCASLPMAPSLIRTTPVGNGEPSNVHIAEAKGEVALKELRIQRFCDLYRLPLMMGEDYRIIGYPSSDEISGTAVNIYKYYMMTAFCDTPDEAWEFLKHQLTVPEKNPRPEIYSLKSTDKAFTAERYEGQHLYIRANGTSASPKPQTVTEPHVALVYSEEHWQEFADFIDSFPGNPLLDQVPDDVMSIVDDEVTDCLRGRTDPDSCVSAIESRVDLWLSEHE